VSVIANLADVVVGAGVVVASADEPAAVLIIYGNLVGLPRKPGQDLAGFAELVAEVRRDSGLGGGAFGLRASFSQDLLARRRMASGQ
jgi:hypothetical protein